MQNSCVACKYNDTPQESTGGRIKNYKYWNLEHIIEPVPVVGWLILKTKRHTEGIFSLTKEECTELGEIISIVPALLKEFAEAEMVYFVSFTEEVRHSHIHIIPRRKDATMMGTELFSMIDKVKEDQSLAKNTVEVLQFANEFKRKLQ